MQTVDEQPETIHLYVVREKEPKPSVFPKVYPATIVHGTLTITNGSIIGQSIPAGFTIQGVATDSALYVPPGNANGYGWAQVEAHSLASGKVRKLGMY